MNRSINTQSAPSLERIFSQRYRNETELARELSQSVQLNSEDQLRADALARLITERFRLERLNQSGLDTVLAEFPLSSPEGKALLNLCEALLRIPDKNNANQLIREQLHTAHWQGHRGHSPSWLVNLATWGLSVAETMSESAGKPIAREVIKHAIEWLANYFVIAENLKGANERAQAEFLYSYDMLGEAALTQAESDDYFAKYLEAIHDVGQHNNGAGPRFGASVSVKLSALHPRFSPLQAARIEKELYPRLLELAQLAKQYDIGLTIDAEESDRLEITLKLFAQLAFEPKLGDWAGLGIAVQAYQKRALAVVQWLAQMSQHRPLMVRLVKGAYWDSEIKTAQQQNLVDYPVFTHKSHTDLSYIACAQVLLHSEHRIYPQFATHNPFTICLIHQLAGERNIEFQALFGMGESLYRLANQLSLNRPCRIYAPIGEKTQLLPYLIRRFLENGANSSFIHLLHQRHKITQFAWPETHQSARLAKPHKLFAPRNNTACLDVSHTPDLKHFQEKHAEFAHHSIIAMPMIGHGLPELYKHRTAQNPADTRLNIGLINEAGLADIEKALSCAAHTQWERNCINHRAQLLEKTADIFAARRVELISTLMSEAGKSFTNAQNEMHEAIDFCRYYAQEAQIQWQHDLPEPIGVIVTISPWNFPLAIFVGQIACALIAGNRVIAKPAEETPLIAMLATRCFYEAGISRQILQFIPGGSAAGAALVLDRRCDGVLFTGSHASAVKIATEINQSGQTKPLISETSSVNCMVVDSTAHIDHACKDVISSAFDSAGQRCSALRVLYLQEEIATNTVARIKQAMAELNIGNPVQLANDIGPVISSAAQRKIKTAIEQYHHCPIYQTHLPPETHHGSYIAPTLIELDDEAAFPDEIFGPVLFIKRFKIQQLKQVVQQINQQQSGLTLSIHSRLRATQDYIVQHARVGNFYINRNQIGAIVGCQPFGGTGKAGSGPKVGGPWSIWACCKNADPCEPHAIQETGTLKALQQIIHEWKEPSEALHLSMLINGIASRTPIGMQRQLPNITGESNTLHYRGLGRIACIDDEAAPLFELIALALLTGNIPVIRYLPGSWRKALANETIEVSEEIDFNLVDGVLCKQKNSTLNIKNPLCPVITPIANGMWPLFRLVSEYTITINTAATGGDLELLCKPDV
ncbi:MULTISPECIES: bifunctional proline dehydrogenase/L-glutamate gamma-semialdehyde dehydrogenase PutA [Deefgea]|uniref:Bifunctional protein PutA n=1 Tax=Deefgea chitinilytica TaxID=570276 RepID=A0ABS2CA38_9NEIS|nr:MULTISPECIES: bifunctional proline dehydrogenase/L-glutamate gamma-semialdehyde dehydrogenase PutA [Deefgea]MBM5571005.1 bifunctional proline dehydrogenase/L-glutamate gamma-semialdehyde dehydrogenase PutA [Deefgea chitinilytica]MBM9888235.1 bifunctional proline dehydrogenase/L-glutamate gamma-semialdehyde dehydrogenase PutA [Deefgea sp. CFH1-16]